MFVCGSRQVGAWRFLVLIGVFLMNYKEGFTLRFFLLVIDGDATGF